jgi:hypothetical protein
MSKDTKNKSLEEEAVDGPSSSLEQAIDFMTESNGCCFDPRHYHSFRAIFFLLPLRACGVCAQRLHSVVPFSSNQVVQCLACKMLAHRTCAMSKTTQWNQPCPVNFEIVQANGKEPISDSLQSNQDDETELKNTSEVLTANSNLPCTSDDPGIIRVQGKPENGEDERESSESAVNDSHSVFRRPAPAQEHSSTEPNSQRPLIRSVVSEGASSDTGIVEGRIFSKANFPFLSASSLFHAKSGSILQSSLITNDDQSAGVIKRSQTWSGPEACTQSTPEVGQPLQSVGDDQIISDYTNDTISTPASAQEQASRLDGNADPASPSNAMEWTAEGPPVHWATGKSLETMFPPKIPPTEPDKEGDDDDSTKEEDGPLHFSSHPFASVSRALHENIIAHFRPVVEPILVKEEATRSKDDSASLHDSASLQVTAQEVDDDSKGPETPSENINDSSDIRTDSSQLEGLLEETASPGTDHRRLGLATVAGGIAGGVAGMVVLGPVGGVIGAKLGQTFGILGVLLEGSLTIGVITSGIAAGRHAGQQLQDKIDEKRVLALRGSGTNQGILLVRPTVKTDPAWGDFCEEAKKSFPKAKTFNFLPSDSKAAKRERYGREIDIVTTDEIEIPTGDKILLLVSRILNNKESMPGHVYRQFIEKVKERAEDRGPLSDIMMETHIDSKNIEDDDEDAPEESSAELIRARRQDAHAVIKYITATLLELRPGFAASPYITESTATAVEALVFGEIYDLVIEEIETEFEEKENELLEKVAAFERNQAHGEDSTLQYKNDISEEALEALHNLPEAHSAVDKLRYCVTFLEKISDFFSADNSNGTKPMGADSLLKLVCQHILAAKVFGINAQVAFLDEFARDEQLLRGKEGYALVTLQASLHFLNASSDFHSDIFEQEDD